MACYRRGNGELQLRKALLNRSVCEPRKRAELDDGCGRRARAARSAQHLMQGCDVLRDERREGSGLDGLSATKTSQISLMK